jgi:hypothetical protein
MTPDLTSQLIADCRALIATMGPVIDLLQTDLAGGVGHTMALNTASGQNALELEAGNGGGGVLRRAAPPAYR